MQANRRNGQDDSDVVDWD